MFKGSYLQPPGRSGPECSPCQSGTGHRPRIKLVSSSSSSIALIDPTYIALLLLVLALVLVLVLGGNAGVLVAGKALNTVSSDLASTVQLRLGVLLWFISFSFLCCLVAYSRHACSWGQCRGPSHRRGPCDSHQWSRTSCSDRHQPGHPVFR